MKPANLRRSTRLTIGLPIVVSGRDAQGNSFTEQTQTIVVNKQGGRISLHREMRLKDPLMVSNPKLQCTANTVVVSLGKPRASGDPWEVAIELLEPQNIWGVSFPPSDWEEGPPLRDHAQEGADPSSRSTLSLQEGGSAPKATVPAGQTLSPAAVAATAESASIGRSHPGSIAKLATEQLPLAATAAPSPASKDTGRGGNADTPARTPTRHAGESLDNSQQALLINFEEEVRRIADRHLKVIERRLLEIGVKHVEEVRKESREAALGTVPESLAELRRQAQGDLENFATHLEEIRKQFQEAAPTLVHGAMMELRRQVAQDLEKFGAHLNELKRQTVNDTLSALRRRLASALKALGE